MVTKVCIKCNIKKSLIEYHKNKRLPDGFQNICKLCKGDYDKQWRQDNIEQCNKSRRKSHLKQAYNLSEKDYDKLYKLQNGCCAICKKHQMELKFILCIDHCHKTGQIRGLLCQSCNKGLGCFKDNLTLLDSAINYLLGDRNEVTTS